MRASTLALGVLGLVACGSKAKEPEPTPGSGSATPGIVLVKDPPLGLDMRLSNGVEKKPDSDKSKLAPASKLDANATTQLLTRAKPIDADPNDQKDFALRPSSQPLPRTGDTIKTTFPADPSTLLPPKPNDDKKDLTVLRYMPEGEVPLAPQLTVTFSHPMVAVTSQDDAAAVTPIKLTPQPKGRWRWLGTRTAIFDPEVRFPQATTYQVEVPAGTKAATGQELKAATKFSFETPTPRLVGHYPYDYEPQRVDEPMFLLFDQKIDAAAVLAKIQAKSNTLAADKTYQLVQLDQTAIAANEEIKYLVEAAHTNEQDGRWVAFRATEKFATDTQITVTVPKGTPSAEGPNTTKDDQQFSFHTYPPLKITRADCSYDRVCRPGQGFWIEFNNPLDVEKLEPLKQKIIVTPAIANMKITSSGGNLYLTGPTEPRTKYLVTIPKDIADDFGQTLGSEEKRSFDVGDAYPTFYGPSGLVVLDPAAKKPTLDFFTTNYSDLKVTIYKVTPNDWEAFQTYEQNRWNKDHPKPIPGAKVFDNMVKTNGPPNKLTEVHVDLAPALENGLGHAIAIIEPSPWKEQYDPPRMIVWAQSTKLAIDAHADPKDINVFATELGSGKPVGGVELALGTTTGTTDGTGLAKLDNTSGAYGYQRLTAKKGGDSVFIINYGAWGRYYGSSPLAWYVIDDRKLYRPGEDVSLKGWLRVIETNKGGDIAAAPAKEVSYIVYDSRNNKIGEGKAALNAAGAFDAKFTLPKTPNLGYARVQMTSDAGMGSYQHQLRVEEFRRPEFEVTATASQGPFLVGQGGDVTVAAKYYAGGGLPSAPVSWNVRSSATSFTPPNREDYSFGTWSPWWEDNYYGGYGYGYDDDYYDDYNPRYRRYGRRGGGGKDKEKHAKSVYEHVAKTDGGGEHILHMDFLSVKPSKPMQVTAVASVTDVNRQQWSASTTLTVHPANYYVGLKSEKSFVEVNDPFELSVIGVDLDGKPAQGAHIDVKAVRLEGDWEKGEYKVKEIDPQTCAVTQPVKEPGACKFATKKGGEYKVTATITDREGRTNETTYNFWVSGGDRIPAREVSRESIKIIPDKKEYSIGNTAELLVQAPFYPAEGLLTWRRQGIVKLERITFDGPTKVVKVPIEDGMTPNLSVQVDLVGMAQRLDDVGKPDPKLPKRPAFAEGQLMLKIPPKHRTLAVTVSPAAAKVSPAEKTGVNVEVKDATGKPVADAEVAVIVVDESILSLAGYTHPTPIDTFYNQRQAGGSDQFSHEYVKLARPDQTVATTTTTVPTTPSPDGAPPPPEAAAAPREEESGGTGTAMALDEGKMGKKDSDRAEGQYKMANKNGDANLARTQAIEQARNAGILGSQKQQGQMAGSGSAAPGQTDPDPTIAVRSNFNPLAAFAPTVKTDAAGKAHVDVTMPDNLTRYRVIAIASSGLKQFGKGESNVTARLPLMIRPSGPRFLNFGDTFEFPVVVQNQTDAPMTVKVAMRATNAKLTDGDGREVTVPANDRVEVRFPAAAVKAGTARFQVVGASDKASDAANVEMPVWTPATTEAFATYGVVDNGATAQPVALPGAVVTEFGGLEVTTASTNLQALTDAFLYIVHYKFDCAEQRSSRILSIVSLQDVLSAFKSPEMPSATKLAASMDDDMAHLTQMQNPDGGFVYWERGYPSEPYLSVYASNAIQRAKDKGYDVPENMLTRAKQFLQNIENYYPWYYGPEIRHAISAYALYTRKLMKDEDIAKAKRLYAEIGGATKTGMETNGWLLAAMAGNASAATERAEIIRHAMNRVSETAGAANFTTGYDDGGYLLLSSDRRVDAVMLDALIQEQPNNDLIPKLVTGLLAHRKAGKWLSTQENSWALIALDRYFRTYEKVTPDFVARVWLGNDYAGDHAFKGRTTEYFQIDVPMSLVATHDKQNLTIQKDGKGRMYYRIGMEAAPASLKLEAADYGFVVKRVYEGIDNKDDVKKAADGTWHIKSGARVRVKLEMANENRRYHVALVDPLPAGLEPVNPTLGVSQPEPPKSESDAKKPENRYSWWYRTWYDHQNMRDERVEAFTQLLWEGVHSYEYTARATTPGNFVVPPPKAEEMYMPETFGRGASDRVIVE